MVDFGLSQQCFLREYFETHFYYRARALDTSWCTWSLIDQALQQIDPGLIKLSNLGERRDDGLFEDYQEIGLQRRRIVKETLYRSLLGGATLVLNRLDTVATQVAALCLELSRFTRCHAVANAYASFGGDGAFGNHWDTHDVVVVQLRGKKAWQLYRPTLELPISTQQSTHCKDQCPAEPCFEQVLTAGDILYVPRGWWHRAQPVDNAETLHLAVGLHAPLVLDYLLWACAKKLPEHIEFRHALNGRESDSQVIDRAADLMTAILRDPSTQLQFQHRTLQRDRVVTPFNLDLLVMQRGQVLPDTIIVRVASRHAGARSGGLFNGRVPRLSIAQHRVLRAISEANVALSLRELQQRLHMERCELSDLLRSLALEDLIELQTAGAPMADPLTATPVEASAI